ncbi:DUF5324 family protein [Streptomyces sp.]|uniref:DUF5324 family protein n=1 Tax=Streptomyces sp. TaxID=1931 RepID=UPI002F3E70FA
MTRIDSVRHAADVTKDSVRHAAEVAAPYASTARENAAHYGRQAGVYGRQAGVLAKHQYEARLAPRVGQARVQAQAAMPPKAVHAMEAAARRTRESARAATEFTAPKVGTVVAVTRSVAVPARDEAVLRGAAALHALRGQVTAEDIDRLVRRRIRREKTGRVFRGLVVVGLAGSAAVAAWKWWSKQANPDWLVEPSEPTGSGDRTTPGGGTLSVVDPLDDTGSSLNGSSPRLGRVDGSPEASGLDPEVEAKQAEADRRDEDEQ